MQSVSATANVCPCDSCGNTNYKSSLCGTGLRVGITTPYQLLECVSCGLVSLQPRPSYDDLLPHYPDWLWRHDLQRRPLLQPKIRVALTALAHWHPRPGRLLDVGCATGDFVLAAQARGWAGHGIEISADQVAVARTRGADVALCADFPAYTPATRYDAVTFNHVLEHVPSPRAYLDKALDLLNPGGVLLIAVPNFNSLSRRLFGRYWMHLDLPRHLYHFTPHTLGRILESLDARVLQVRYADREQHALGLRSSLWRWLRYGVLQRRPAPEALAARDAAAAAVAATRPAAGQRLGAGSIVANMLRQQSRLLASITEAARVADTFLLVATGRAANAGRSKLLETEKHP